MTKRSKYARIPAEEVQDPKKWHLPYWVEPSHLVQKDDEIEVEDEEIEVEVEPLTAEQLEQIRQEAYNEGLEQGLVEGRQKGERLGYEDGFNEGKEEGYQEGQQQGLAEGKTQGEAQALQEGRAKTEQKVTELTTLLTALAAPIENEKRQLEALLPELVLKLTEQIIQAELSQGSEHAMAFCQKAVDALPTGAKNITVYVSPHDLPYVEAALEQHNESWDVQEDDELQAGGCRVESHESIVDFTLERRWQTLVDEFLQSYKLGELHADELPHYEFEDEHLDESLGNNLEENTDAQIEDQIEDQIDDQVEVRIDELENEPEEEQVDDQIDELENELVAEQAEEQIAEQTIEQEPPYSNASIENNATDTEADESAENP